MADLDDVHEQAAAISHVAAGHVGPHHAAVLLRGGLDGVHLGGAGDEVLPPGHVPRGVDVLDARAEVIVDHDASLPVLRHLEARVLQPTRDWSGYRWP